MTQVLTPISKLLDCSWDAAAYTSSSSMCTLVWKMYQFTQVSTSSEKAIPLVVPEARSARRVRISRLFDYSEKHLCKINSVDA